MDYRMIKFSVSEQIATITLDYAPTLNALDFHMALELEDALKKSEESPDVSVVIITGAGRAFCGGGDIRYMKAHCEEPDFSKKSMGPLAGKLSEIVLYIKKMKKIVICAVAGAAAGGGANLAFGCDFIFAADNAKFLQAFVGIGLCPDTGGTYFLPRMIGTHRAFDMFVTGRPVSAEEAFYAGIVKEITTKEDKPYDLTTLQRQVNKYFGYSANDTLNLAQGLYEKKLITYPRTDSRYLTDDMVNTMKELLEGLEENFKINE